MIAGLALWDKDCLVSGAHKAAPGDSGWPTSGLTEGRGAKGGERGGGGGEAAAAARRRRRGAGRLLAGRVWNFRFVR